MDKFSNWLSEAVAAEDQKTLAKWAQKQVREKFGKELWDFSMNIDQFVAAFGVRMYDQLKAHGLLRIQDMGKNRMVSFRVNKKPATGPATPAKPGYVAPGAGEVMCYNCGTNGPKTSPRCPTCGAAGDERFLPMAES